MRCLLFLICYFISKTLSLSISLKTRFLLHFLFRYEVIFSKIKNKTHVTLPTIGQEHVRPKYPAKDPLRSPLDLLPDPKRLRVRWSFSLLFSPPPFSEKHRIVLPARRLVSSETGQTATHRLVSVSVTFISTFGSVVEVVVEIAFRIYLRSVPSHVNETSARFRVFESVCEWRGTTDRGNGEFLRAFSRELFKQWKLCAAVTRVYRSVLTRAWCGDFCETSRSMNEEDAVTHGK